MTRREHTRGAGPASAEGPRRDRGIRLGPIQELFLRHGGQGMMLDGRPLVPQGGLVLPIPPPPRARRGSG